MMTDGGDSIAESELISSLQVTNNTWANSTETVGQYDYAILQSGITQMTK